jgi:SRSO17 transposase
MAGRFVEFCNVFAHHFQYYGRDSTHHARSYLSGLLGTARRKNIGRIEEDVAESNYQGMQQFISDAPWNHHELLDAISYQAEGMLGGHRDSALYLDESSFQKKGHASVGVKRQYCGRLGKIENCQVGVFACLGRGDRTQLVDFRLFMPEDWANDEERCKKAKVPEQERVHRTKAELALEMVQKARERGLSYQWIGGDAAYGVNSELTEALEDMGEVFLMDVTSVVKVWDQDLALEAPGKNPGRGRPYSIGKIMNPDARQRSVADLAQEYFESESRFLTLRNTTKAPLVYRVWVKEVWLWNKTSASPRRRLLVVRRDADGQFKYSLSNAPSETSWERLGYMQAQRFWIERAFQDAKSELGMAQYEVRTWKGWHHHMALVCLAMLFVTKERLLAQEDTPLLSARDIVELLDVYLPRRHRDPEEVLRIMQFRHRQRDLAAQGFRKRAEIADLELLTK